MKALSTALQEQTEAWSNELMQNSRLTRLARSGQLSERALAVYLASMRHLLEHSERNLGLAADRARALGEHDIAAYFAGKAREEDGHDQWAVDDMRQLPSGLRVKLQPTASMLALTHHQDHLIARAPICFVAYALWAEYFTALAGDDWLDALACSGFAPGRVSSIAKHIEADRAHAQHGLRAIDGLWNGKPDASTIIAGVTEARRIFEGFFDDVWDVAAHAA